MIGVALGGLTTPVTPSSFLCCSLFSHIHFLQPRLSLYNALRTLDFLTSSADLPLQHTALRARRSRPPLATESATPFPRQGIATQPPSSDLQMPRINYIFSLRKHHTARLEPLRRPPSCPSDPTDTPDRSSHDDHQPGLPPGVKFNFSWANPDAVKHAYLFPADDTPPHSPDAYERSRKRRRRGGSLS